LLLETNNVIANKQAEFRIHRSTSEHIANLSQFIKDALDNKHILTAVFIDFKSAYDSVWKENLLLKLIRSRIIPYLTSSVCYMQMTLFSELRQIKEGLKKRENKY